MLYGALLRSPLPDTGSELPPPPHFLTTVADDSLSLIIKARAWEPALDLIATSVYNAIDEERA